MLEVACPHISLDCYEQGTLEYFCWFCCRCRRSRGAEAPVVRIAVTTRKRPRSGPDFYWLGNAARAFKQENKKPRNLPSFDLPERLCASRRPARSLQHPQQRRNTKRQRGRCQRGRGHPDRTAASWKIESRESEARSSQTGSLVLAAQQQSSSV